MLTRSGRTPETNEITKQRREKSTLIKAKRLEEIKLKLEDISDALKNLDLIECVTEDALLNWLRGPVSVSF